MKNAWRELEDLLEQDSSVRSVEFGHLGTAFDCRDSCSSDTGGGARLAELGLAGLFGQHVCLRIRDRLRRNALSQ